VVAVANEESEWRPERAAVAQARQDFHFVGLDLLPRAAAVALLASAQVAVDGGSVELEPGRQALDDGD
jgi:hypothetical protein